MKGYASIAHRLHYLTAKGARFNWSEDCEAAFQTLKQRLYFTPHQVLPDFSRDEGTFILDTDASETAIGAVLSQKGNVNVERVIVYGSRGLSVSERNCVMEMKCGRKCWR